MSENNYPLSDSELQELLKARFLTQPEEDALSDKLLEMQANAVFTAPALVTPPISKEAKLLAKTGSKAAGKFSWLFIGLSTAAIVAVTSAVLLFYPSGKITTSINANNKANQTAATAITSPKAKTDAVPSVSITSTGIVNERHAVPTNSVATYEHPAGASSTTVVAEEKMTTAAVTTKTITPTVSLNAPGISETKTATPSLPSCTKSEEKRTQINKNMASYGRIWKTSNYCDFPDSLKFPYSIDCEACDFDLPCKEINNKTLTAVIVQINAIQHGWNKKQSFNLKNGLEGIRLEKAGGGQIHPVAISLGRYISKAYHVKIMFKNDLNMVFLFEKAEPGDKIVIDGFTEGVILK